MSTPRNAAKADVRHRLFSTAALVILLCGLLICSACKGRGEEGPRVAPDTGIGVQYAEIKGNRTAMSEADWKKYKDSLWGTEIQWIGWVNKVEGSGNSSSIISGSPASSAPDTRRMTSASAIS